jgi:ribosomal protein L28
MRRATVSRAFAVIATSVVITVSAFGQGHQIKSKTNQSKPHGGRATGRTYTPRIHNYSATSIVEGRVLSIEAAAIRIKTDGGARHEFLIDEATSIFESGELVSIATMADITLKPSDLKPSDVVEIVVERAGRSPAARIITRVERSAAQVAKR